MATKVKRGDTEPLPFTLSRNGRREDLTGAAVEFHMNPRVGGTAISGACVLTDAEQGEGNYPWGTGETGTIGTYDAEYQVTFADGKIKTWPGGYEVIEIVQDLGD